MSIVNANISDAETVKLIAETTISAVYPHYYPMGAVGFFLSHHSMEHILTDIARNIVFICIDNKETVVGTVTIRDNEISRLFVLPVYQGKGYGRELLDFAESEIFLNYSQIRLDASLPAKRIYLNRGYRDVEYHVIEAENGDFLCYDVMEKNNKS